MAKITTLNAFDDDKPKKILLTNEELEKILKTNFHLRMVDTEGLRNSYPLTQEQYAEAEAYAIKLGMLKNKIRRSDHINTIYVDDWDLLVIGTDVFPLPKRTDNPNSNISVYGAIAHEIVGHREAFMSGNAILTKEDKLNKMSGTIDLKIYVYKNLLDEVQASIRAAKFTPDLIDLERKDLWDDAIIRLKKNRINFEEIKNKLAINVR